MCRQMISRVCPIHAHCDLVSKRWTVLILLELYREKSMKLRYTELKRSLYPITSRMLSVRLKELEGEGLVERKTRRTGKRAKSCHYQLTECGTDFTKVAMEMKRWALKWKIDDITCENTDCNGCPRVQR